MLKEKDKVSIRGLQLEIDKSIEETCRLANQSSTQSRSILYIIIFICVIALLALINNRADNWVDLRLNYYKKYKSEIVDSFVHYNHFIKKSITDSSLNSILPNHDNLAHQYEKLEYKINGISNVIDKYEKVRAENNTRIHIPIIGTSTDINDLGMTSGISLSILLMILLFSMSRELDNLVIAFHAITERYTDDCDAESFIKFIEKEKLEVQSTLTIINLTRRKHHYNYLSMNEVFTLTLFAYSERKIHLRRKLTYLPFFLPFFLHLLIYTNDISTIKNGLILSELQTVYSMIANSICFVFIIFMTYNVLDVKLKYYRTWDKFFNNQFKM